METITTISDTEQVAEPKRGRGRPKKAEGTKNYSHTITLTPTEWEYVKSFFPGAEPSLAIREVVETLQKYRPNGPSSSVAQARREAGRLTRKKEFEAAVAYCKKHNAEDSGDALSMLKMLSETDPNNPASWFYVEMDRSRSEQFRAAFKVQ
jgi:hypothetical protein